MDDKMWQAIVQCDAAYDGVFYYGVKTTRIFCRPSCKSKTPRREHVRVFCTVEEARKAGFRPCKRCRPEDLEWDVAAEIARKVHALIDARYMESWSLARFGRELSVSPYHLHRMFARHAGMSPMQALLRKRFHLAKALLAGTDASITDIALLVGFRSVSHFSAIFAKHVGCPPSEYRAKCREDGRGARIAESPITHHGGLRGEPFA
jgi:AraC family transcriptional regulator of adaptative response / methylphosphotriester-DNA alkyltransferase methyltransferase